MARHASSPTIRDPRGASTLKAASTFTPGEVIAGKYLLKEPLRRGGMGSVWVATHLSLDTPVAVKFMLEVAGSARAGVEAAAPSSTSLNSFERFDREAKAAAQIRSANVVQILDYGIDRGAQYIVMELLNGEDLGARLKRMRRLPLEEVCRLVVAVARALQRAHDVGLVHRDLKPANVFLAREGDEIVPKVLDFGVAKVVHERPVGEGTMEGTLVGTPSYMSPEQAMGRSGVDHRADLWSLGVIVYRALTGARPFESASLLELVVQICSRSPVPPTQRAPGLPVEIDAFIAQALERDPSKRFQSAREMARALLAIAPLRPSVPSAGMAVGFADGLSMQNEGAGSVGGSTLAMPSPFPDTFGSGAPARSSRSDSHVGTVPPSSTSRSSGIPPYEPGPPGRAVAPPRGRAALIAVVLAVCAAFAVTGALLIRASRDGKPNRRPEPELAAKVPSAATAAPSASSTITAPKATTTTTTTTAAATAPTGSPERSPTASALASAPPVTTAPAKARAPRAPSNAKSVDCSAPFYWDSKGTKFIKPECL